MPDQTPREQLAALLVEHAPLVRPLLIECRGCAVSFGTEDAFAGHLAGLIESRAGWRPPARVITDRAELDSLSYPAIIREEPADPTEFFPQIWEMGYQTGWCRVGHRFFDLDDCTPRLPVRVLHTPENGDTP